MSNEKHEWTMEEDTLLVASLLDLYNKGTFNADNGFKHGYLEALEEEIRKHLPNTTIKAKPNIESRLKTLKANFSLVYDMVYGPNTSGFGWDPNNKFVVTETPVWEAYLKAHPKAKKVRGKKFEHFETLCIIYGRDRATGRDAQTAADIVEEIRNEEVQTNEEEYSADMNMYYDYYMSMPPNIDIPHSSNANVPTPQASTAPEPELAPQIAEPTSHGKRKRKSSIDNAVVQAIREASSTLGTHIENASLEMSMAMGVELKFAEKRDKFYEELHALKELSTKQRHTAGRIIGSDDSLDDSLVALFFSLPLNERVEFVKDIIDNP